MTKKKSLIVSGILWATLCYFLVSVVYDLFIRTFISSYFAYNIYNDTSNVKYNIFKIEMQLGSLEAIYDICLKAYNIIYLENCNLPANMHGVY